MKKFKFIIIGLVILLIGAICFFNISLTSLPTIFSNMIDKELPELDYNKIRNLEIEKSYAGQQNIIIENKDEIKSILNNLFNNELRIYNGGRLDFSGSEYDL